MRPSHVRISRGVFASSALAAVMLAWTAVPAATAASRMVARGTPPVINTFQPRSGPVGTLVTIDGSHFTGTTSVTFNGHGATFSVVNDGRVTATVPSGATTGKIRVTTPNGFDDSSESFSVVAATHDRSVSLNLRGHLTAYGQVMALDGYQACQGNVPVILKRFHGGRWRWVATTATDNGGAFRALLRDRSGRYRARAKRIVLVNGAICLGDRSQVVWNHH